MKYLTRKEVAERLHRQPRWVTDKLLKPGLLKGVRFGFGNWLIPEGEFCRYMSQKERYAAQAVAFPRKRKAAR